jgi:hypothetical protein
MAGPRVKRSKGPPGVLTKNNCRKKALPYLKADFKNRCAYCLRDMTQEHPNQSHVEHFNSHLPNRKKNQYKNLMLGCSACNLSKLTKFVTDPIATDRRMLNCTIENEFPTHIIENEITCKWDPQTPAGDYHIMCMDLNEGSHVRRRERRRKIVEHILKLEANAVHYSGPLLISHLTELNKTIQLLKDEIRNCVPFPTKTGLIHPITP